MQQSQTEKLLEVLNRRQEVLDQSPRFEKTSRRPSGDGPSIVRSSAPSLRDKAEALLAETRRLLEQITTADRNDALVLQQRKLNLGRQINQATAARTREPQLRRRRLRKHAVADGYADSRTVSSYGEEKLVIRSNVPAAASIPASATRAIGRHSRRSSP